MSRTPASSVRRCSSLSIAWPLLTAIAPLLRWLRGLDNPGTKVSTFDAVYQQHRCKELDEYCLQLSNLKWRIRQLREAADVNIRWETPSPVSHSHDALPSGSKLIGTLHVRHLRMPVEKRRMLQLEGKRDLAAMEAKARVRDATAHPCYRPTASFRSTDE
jgi:hypothetical protein